MAPFPDNLPPEALDEVTKLLIYFGILYILSTAITTWLITRRRSFPKKSKAQQQDPIPEARQDSPRVGITETISFEDTKDKLSSMKIEVRGAEAALTRLNELYQQEELSETAYSQLSSEYSDRVEVLTDQINEMLHSDIQTHSGEVSEGISDDEINALEADLEQQLMDLDDDDSFLKPRPKRNINEIFDEPKSNQPSTPATPAARQPMSQPSQPSVPSTKPQSESEKKRVPMPPPPGKPKQTQSTSPPPTSSSPATSVPPAKNKSVPMPPPPKKTSAPPPPRKSESQASQPKATAPGASKPLSAAQPMKVQSEDDEGMFAKSTSIAALRMDMLRELARLKKLIPEDQEKDQ